MSCGLRVEGCAFKGKALNSHFRLILQLAKEALICEQISEFWIDAQFAANIAFGRFCHLFGISVFSPSAQTYTSHPAPRTKFRTPHFAPSTLIRTPHLALRT